MLETTPYQPKNKIRIVTSTSLFDGHDAAINIMRRIIQTCGVEIIHLGHNRSVAEIANCAIQEDVHAIAITSYQGGHIEFFKYLYDELQKVNPHIMIFGGGGGTILPKEITELHNYGISKIYSPDDGRKLGLQGMINDMVRKCDYKKSYLQITNDNLSSVTKKLKAKNKLCIAQLLSLSEEKSENLTPLLTNLDKAKNKTPVLGITGTGGAGKSSLVDDLIRRFLNDFPEKQIAILAIDPSKRKTGGAFLGDRIRMNAINKDNVYMRSMATRQSNVALSSSLKDALSICKLAQFDLIIIETSGIGQSDTAVVEFSDLTLYIMTSEYGAASQLEKIDMLDYADIVVLNKFDKKGSLDAYRDVCKQYQRNKLLFETENKDLPIFGTIASQFKDPQTDRLYIYLMAKLDSISPDSFKSSHTVNPNSSSTTIIPNKRVNYLQEIVNNNQDYKKDILSQTVYASQLYSICRASSILNDKDLSLNDMSLDLDAFNFKDHPTLKEKFISIKQKLSDESLQLLSSWPQTVTDYNKTEIKFKVRNKELTQKLTSKTLSHLDVPKISLPKLNDWGDILRFRLTENLPGQFPYTAGVFAFKRNDEDPTRMFAGEGDATRTNRRFHYLSLGQSAKRLSTAFDSVTLYGEDPDLRADIYGKVGNSGVSIASLDEMKILYSGFNLKDPSTSVSMTINGPAPMLLAYYLNTAIDQQCELYIKEQGKVADVESKIAESFKLKNLPRPTYSGDLPEGNNGLGLLFLGANSEDYLDADIYNKIKQETMQSLRGTVQADILKEDQAQNTCIFSTDFSLKLMGDIQEYFIAHSIRNFYSVSISGYHIAEAGANPITQLAFTLANGFTYVEYYLARGMKIDEFAHNLSYFFSNGLDPEYAVLGRVARKIWAQAVKFKYKGNSRSQKLKYHIQTSGRSLHAQEIAFNDIRTTLQALYAIYDNCNSLHTNAFDEAITTPTEKSVRRAVAIQLIINKEYGLNTNDNPLQGSYIIDDLTELVEEAVYVELNRISDRGGVLGAMERMYQRTKIQEESLYYEDKKHNGELEIVGVNTFLDPEGSPTIIPNEIIRATTSEKDNAVTNIKNYKLFNQELAKTKLANLKKVANSQANIFNELIETAKHCTLKQISSTLYDVGGEYRRSM